MKFFISLLAFLGTFQLFSQQITHNLQSENLKGKLHYYYLKTFIATDTDTELSQKYAEKKVFDKDGNLTEIINFDADSQPINKTLFKFKNRRLIGETYFNASGNQDKTITYQYDDKERLSCQKKYNTAGKLQYQITYFYNTKGQLSATHKLIPSINYTMKENYKYNTDGNLIEVAKKVRIGSTKETYVYNQQKQLIKKSEYNALGELFSTIEYTYNENADKTALKKYDADGNLTYYESYQYTYDTHDNWTERISFKRDKKVSIETRELVYYQ